MKDVPKDYKVQEETSLESQQIYTTNSNRMSVKKSLMMHKTIYFVSTALA